VSVRKPNGGIQQMLRDEPGSASWPIHAQRVAPWAYRYTDFPTLTRDDIMRFVPAVMPRGKGS
jgi:hypothetical protein